MVCLLILVRLTLSYAISAVSRRFLFSLAPYIVQNPGRVVTLIHQEEWDAFSGVVSFLCPLYPRARPLCPFPLRGGPRPCPIMTYTNRGWDLYQVDPFPHEDIVWGTFAH
jgi:hypothetical protein